MSKKTHRDMAVSLVNIQARDCFDGYKSSKSKCEKFHRMKQIVLNLAKDLKMTYKECYPELLYIQDDFRDSKNDVNLDLIQRAKDIIESQYQKDKYSGREAEGLFRTLFGKISEKALRNFDEN